MALQWLSALSVAPVGWSRRVVRLADGATVTLREARGDNRDARGLRALFYTLSDTTRYLYFCVGAPRNEVWAERVAQLGEARTEGYALVAEVAGVIVGVARFDHGAYGRAEIGILLTDAWQSRGLGPAVVARLRAAAERHQLTGFTATVLGENRKAMRLLRRAFPDMVAHWSAGQYTVDMPFAGAALVMEEGNDASRYST
jgi:acetyltransferase